MAVGEKWVAIKQHWPQVLFCALVTAFALNLAYLLWPAPREDIVIIPHPAMLAYQAQQTPVVVQTNTGADAPVYAMLNVDSQSGAISRVHKMAAANRHHQGSPDKKNFQGVLALNQASISQLQQLPGIGPKMAQRIVAYRHQVGGFKNLNQLLEVPGIGPKKFEKLLPHCKL